MTDIDRCGIKHGFGDQVCNKAKGHDGNCQCKAVRGVDGTITCSEWVSRNGKFHRHVGYHTIRPKNAVREK